MQEESHTFGQDHKVESQIDGPGQEMINANASENPDLDTDVNSCTSNIEEQKVNAKESSQSLQSHGIKSNGDSENCKKMQSMDFDNNFEDNEQDQHEPANEDQGFNELVPIAVDPDEEYERQTIEENDSEHDSWILKSQQGEQPYSYDKFSVSGASSPYDIWKGPNEDDSQEASFRLHKTFGKSDSHPESFRGSLKQKKELERDEHRRGGKRAAIHFASHKTPAKKSTKIVRDYAPQNLIHVKYDFPIDSDREEEKKEEERKLDHVDENPQESDSDDDPDLSSSHCDVEKDDFQTRLKLSKFNVKGENKESPKLFRQAKAEGKKISFFFVRDFKKMDREDTLQ